MRERTVSEHLKEELKDPYFKELYELEQQKFSIVKLVVGYRIENNLTQSQLAEKVGVTQQFISKIENGEFSSFSTLAKVLFKIGYSLKLKPVALEQARQTTRRKILTAKRK